MSKIIQTQCPALLIFLIVGVLLLVSSCKEEGIGSPQGYDMSKPDRRELSKVLNEISGLSYNPDDSTFLAISDGKQNIFAIDLKKKNHKLSDYSKKFFEQKDFEDLVKLDSLVYVLVSDGTILEVPLKVNNSGSTTAYPFWLEGKNDFETLYYDSAANGLIIICKTCEHEKGEDIRTAYRFDLAGKRFDTTEYFTIDAKHIKAMLKDDAADFKPSAAAINPIDKRLYILASAGQLMVITDTKGNVMEAYRLHPDQHVQAEGIAFTPKGTMVISNEKKTAPSATLQIFQYRKDRKEEVAGR